MSTVQQIIEKYLDDPDQISDWEMATMVVALRKSPEMAVDLKDQLLLHELLGQRYAVDRQNFVAQVDQRIRDFSTGEQELADQVVELRSIAENELGAWDQRNRRARRRNFWMGTAVVLLLSLGIGGWFAVSPQLFYIAVIESPEGDFEILRNGRPVNFVPGQSIRIMRGDRIDTHSGRSVLFSYNDGTQVQVGSNSKIQFDVSPTTGGKQVVVLSGDVSAKVAPQKLSSHMVFQTPVAEAEVLGTELFLSASDRSTRLDVTKGSVKLNQSSVDRSVIVNAGNYGIATTSSLHVEPLTWPGNRDRLVFMFQTADQPNFVYDPRTELMRRCQVQAKNLADFNNFGAMTVVNGSFVAAGMEDEIIGAIRDANEITFEAFITPGDSEQAADARIVTICSQDSSNLSLIQKKNRLIVRLRTSTATEDNSQPPITLCELPDSKSHHIALAYKTGYLTFYLDGEEKYASGIQEGDLSTWSQRRIVFGNKLNGGSDWAGTIEGIAIYSRFVDAKEIKANADAYRKLVDARRAIGRDFAE